MFGLNGMNGSEPAPEQQPAPAAPAEQAMTVYEAATKDSSLPEQPPAPAKSETKPAEVVKPEDKPKVPAIAPTSTGINWLALAAALGVVWLATKYLRRS